MSSFPQFRQLPVELQLKIFSISLQPDSVVPRTVKVDFAPEFHTYRYQSQPPPLTQTCRASREVALKCYSILNPSMLNKRGPIYFHHAVDILHYHPHCERHYDRDSLDTTALDPDLPTHLIRHIMITQTYLTLRASDSFTCPIFELRYFGNLETLYIGLPSHAELEEHSTRWYKELMRLTPGHKDAPPSLPHHLIALYTREKLEEASGRRDIVPGHTLLSGDKESLRKHQLLSCFGWQEGGISGAWICGDGSGRGDGRIRRGEGWQSRELPALKYTSGLRWCGHFYGWIYALGRDFQGLGGKGSNGDTIVWCRV
ncbi:hypothetical protein BOTCAL_0188g00130 [Botryotinia calthae]|uniref:2EXR domain-containing protein n=1 Tax=Botryotinia calthae TaxID=38488 RepID=A0A4Y8D006_9HELO|nr:hypothetical protein BOTCAL_0188g00130 [Botryotinia calthae]